MNLSKSDLDAITVIVKTELSPLNDRLDKLEADVSSLKSGQKQIRRDIKRLDDKVNATYDLALDAWGGYGH